MRGALLFSERLSVTGRALRIAAVSAVLLACAIPGQRAACQTHHRVPAELQHAVLGCWVLGPHERLELVAGTRSELKAVQTLDRPPPGRRQRRFVHGVSFDPTTGSLSFLLAGRHHEHLAIVTVDPAGAPRIRTYGRRSPRDVWRWTGNDRQLTPCADE